jgi:hypothetical protein
MFGLESFCKPAEFFFAQDSYTAFVASQDADLGLQRFQFAVAYLAFL